MINRIRYTCILSYALVIKINLAVSIKCNILQKSIASDCIVDVRLRILIQVDDLCIASALEVKYAVVIPAVLVITDKKTLGVC